MVLALTLIVSLFSYPTFAAETTNTTIYIKDYYNNEATYTDAIVRANAYLKSIGGGTLVFSAGDYLVKPSKIVIPSNVTWQGQGTARIYTQETSLYHVLIATEYGAKNIQIRDLVFDQSKDAALLPNISIWRGAFMFHVNGADQVVFSGNTFYTYGVCAILTQSDDTYPSQYIEVVNNKAYFERKVDQFYDVSVFNIDAKTVKIEDNYIEAKQVPNFTYSKPRTAIEVHTPNGTMDRNTTSNTEVGILHTNWPSLWKTYDASFNGTISISDNNIQKAIIGIDVFSADTIANTVTRNLTVNNNTVNLHHDANSYPARGIALSDGSTYSGSFENIQITNNKVSMTSDFDQNYVASRFYLLIPGKDVGALYMNVQANISNMNVENNYVENFPYTFLSLNRKAGDASNLHQDITVKGNTAVETSFVSSYGQTYDAAINLGNVKNVALSNNLVINKATKLIKDINEITNVNSTTYDNNFFGEAAPVVEPVVVKEVVDKAVTEVVAEEPVNGIYVSGLTAKDSIGVIGTYANGTQIYATERAKVAAGDVIKTPNGEYAKVASSSGNYIFLETAVATWVGGQQLSVFAYTAPVVAAPVVEEPVLVAPIVAAPAPAPAPTTTIVTKVVTSTSTVQVEKDSVGVIGTWANGTQIYATSRDKVVAGDIIKTPNNETAVVASSSGNYLFLETAVASWAGGQQLYVYALQTIVTETIVEEVVVLEPVVAPVVTEPVVAPVVTAPVVAPVIEPVVEEPVVVERAYVNVIGTWASTKQIYVTNIDQCQVGDTIVTPKGQKSVIKKVSGNYIYLTSGVKSWTGGQAIKLAD